MSSKSLLLLGASTSSSSAFSWMHSLGLKTDLALLVLDFVKFPDVDVLSFASESGFACSLALGRVGQRLGVSGCSVNAT